MSLNVCLTLLKKDKKRNEQYFISDALPANLIQDNQVFLDEDLQQLYNGIKQLSEIDRAIILLYLEERPYIEIAKIIGTNTNNIGVKIKRIKERLKIILTKFRVLLGPFNDIKTLEEIFNEIKSLEFENLEILRNV